MKRLDLEVVERGLALSRNRATCLIREGAVKVDGKVLTKPSSKVSDENEIELCGGGLLAESVLRFAGKGAVKLCHALEYWNLDVHGLCVDVGASSGGFTDVLLEYGASFVVAVDVGKNQLVERLRRDHRVFSVEETDVRLFDLRAFLNLPSVLNRTGSAVFQGADLITCDVSFISATKIMKSLFEMGNRGCRYIILIKPQFESEERKTLKNGVVRDEKNRKKAVDRVVKSAEEHGLFVVGVTESPIAGGSGNLEYLAYFIKN